SRIHYCHRRVRFRPPRSLHRPPGEKEGSMTMRATVPIAVAASLTVAGQVWAAPQAGGEPPSMNTPPPGPPPADQPLVQQIPRPHTYSLEGGAGLLGYFSGAGRLGPAWNVRF